MKAIKLFSMAVAALMMAACSNEDSEILQNTQQPGTMHFTATIAAPSGDATTRTVYTEVGTTINVNWEVGDEIALVHNGVVDVAEVKTVDNVTGKATIEATITGSPSDDDDVYLAYPADAVYEATPYPPLPFTPNTTTFNKVKNQEGTLEFIQNNLDFRMGSGKLAVSGSDVSLKESVSVSSLICIWKLTLQDNAATPNALNATQLTFKNNTYIQAKATSAAKSDYYLCVVPSFIPDASGTFSFEATVGSDTYTYTKAGGVSLTEGKFYQSTVTLTKPAASKIVDLSSLSDDYEAQDGDVLTGTLDVTNYPVKISIANNATVTLNGVTINGKNGNSYEWAGLTCSGNATIILKDGTTNIVKGFYEDYPGIYVPENKTVTIQGSGSLTASSNGYGAGIGGGFGISCGNIEIQGGVITATGGWSGAGIGAGSGIGTGESICGTITISGGTVTAIGGDYAAGIGSGYAQTKPSTCGAISISGGTVSATAGYSAPAAIGKGGVDTSESTCASVTFTPDITSLTLTNTNSGVTGIVSNFINATAVNANTTPITTMLSTSVTDPAITGGMATAGFATLYDGDAKTWTITKK